MNFVEFTILCMYFDMFLPTMLDLCFLFMFNVLGGMFWTYGTY